MSSSADDSAMDDRYTMTKTIIIAVCCVVAYLGVMVALTTYCLVHMIRARKLRKQSQDAQSDNGELYVRSDIGPDSNVS